MSERRGRDNHWWIWAGLAVLIAGMAWSALDPRSGGAYGDSSDSGYTR